MAQATAPIDPLKYNGTTLGHRMIDGQPRNLQLLTIRVAGDPQVRVGNIATAAYKSARQGASLKRDSRIHVAF
jgi:hypothetical protein